MVALEWAREICVLVKVLQGAGSRQCEALTSGNRSMYPDSVFIAKAE